MILKTGSAHWEGSIREGSGSISTQSGALAAQPYGFAARFEGRPGTNPEELIAAAHAACFSMALSGGLAAAGVGDVVIDTVATVKMEKQEAGFAITASMLRVRVSGAGTPEVIRAAAEAAKAGCPVSKVLSCEVGMELEIVA
ncbi:Peroxiredoxin OsmC [bioreactor metagenome]|uniref:Peroxiredoxin OsmC n=1 Tax=bioreactor metagenome TaxID=1076179 RepID=A0A644U263_9ZZZZ